MIEYLPKIPETNHNISKEHPLKGFLKVAVFTIVSILILFVVLSLIAQFFAVHLPPTLERKMGTLWSCSDQRGYDDLKGQFQYLVNHLPEDGRTRFDYRLCVVDSERVNAGALPGGMVMIFTGLLEKVTDPEALQFVLAHELGHIYHKDHLKQIGRGLVILSIQGLIGFGGGDLALVDDTMDLLNLTFSRDQEFAADRFAVELLKKADINPQGGVVLMEQFSRIQRSPFQFKYTSSHPDPKGRIKAIQRLIKSD